MKMAQEERPIADAFVSVCSPDRIRKVFEEHSRWWTRPDVFLSIWMYGCARAAGLTDCEAWRGPPWPPTWHGYMKPRTERFFEALTGQRRPFEELEHEHFDGSLRSPVSVPCLRIICPNDPVVRCETLEHELLKHCEVLWEPRGGHCGQFFCSSACARRLRQWVLEAERGLPNEPACSSILTA